MNKIRMLLAGTGTALAVTGTAVCLAVPAAAALPYRSGYRYGNGCYAQGVERIGIDEKTQIIDGQRVWVSHSIMVTEGSPCEDINLRAAVSELTNRYGVKIRMRYWEYGQEFPASPWVTVGRGWRVVEPNAFEGFVYHLEATEPATVDVRG